MNLLDYSQFGVAIFSIGALCYCIERFLKFMARQEESFRDTIDNHLNNATSVANEQLKSAQNLNKAVDELLTFLRYSNGNHRKKGKR